VGQDQRWTLARVAALIARLFGVGYTLRGASYLLHRLGFTPEVPAHRAVEAAWASMKADLGNHAATTSTSSRPWSEPASGESSAARS
jgi:transposase